jgi:hypothetical protein
MLKANEKRILEDMLIEFGLPGLLTAVAEQCEQRRNDAIAMVNDEAYGRWGHAALCVRKCIRDIAKRATFKERIVSRKETAQ